MWCFLSSFFSLFLPNLQALENVLGLVQNLSQNLIAELAPLGLGDLAFLELVELDRVFVCHGVTLVELAFSVYFFFTFFSDFDHHASVVSEGCSAIAAFCKRGEVKDFRRLGCHVRHCFAFGLARSHTDFAIRQSVRDRDQNHALELADLQDRHFVFHVHTMHEILQVVNF